MPFSKKAAPPAAETITTRQRDKPQQFTRELAINFKAVEGDENSRRIKLSFSSEEPYERWYGPEILDHKEESVLIDRLRNIGCVLFNHHRDQVVAKILSVDIVGNRGEAEIEFDDDELSEIIFKKVKSGTLKGVSVGYVVYRYETVKEGKKSSDGRFTGPCSIATSWEPFEISIVSVPADPTVGVGRELEAVQQRQAADDLEIYRAQLKINQNLLYGGLIK